jgi:uncharacterized pyridoxal phosphate-dependent enzyme
MTSGSWLDDPHGRLGLTRVINAAGSYTPLGVSRSPAEVAAAASAALQHWFVIEELHQLVGERLAAWANAEAAMVTHCAAAGITLCTAAAIAGSDPERVAQLPETSGLARRVVLPAGHAVNYGHPIVQDIRLAGGVPSLAGCAEGCSLEALRMALDAPDVVALLLVASRLTTGAALDLAAAVRLAHQRGVPAIIDGAAQDWRARDLIATGCDAWVVSGHKYMASPTAGLVIGTRDFVHAVRAQERGIGRAMKVTKEALLGVLAALDHRDTLDRHTWEALERERARRVAAAIDELPGLRANAVPDPVGMPFDRVSVTVDPAVVGTDAQGLAARLETGSPSVRVMSHELREERLVLEVVGFSEVEERCVVAALRAALSTRSVATSEQPP